MDKKSGPKGEKGSAEVGRKIKLNIGGTLFTTTKETLATHPDTRLAKLNSSSQSYDKVADEHFYDRDPVAFACILNWYRTSELHLPDNLCGNAIRRELDFWEVKESEVEECCWKLLHDTDQGKAVIDTLNSKLREDDMTPGESPSSWKIWQHRLWLVLDKPNSSRAAKEVRLRLSPDIKMKNGVAGLVKMYFIACEV